MIAVNKPKRENRLQSLFKKDLRSEYDKLFTISFNLRSHIDVI
jgi:hypothetical protein